MPPKKHGGKGGGRHAAEVAASVGNSKSKFEPKGFVDPVFALLFLVNVGFVGGYVYYAYSKGQLQAAYDSLSSDDTVELLQGNFTRAKANPQAAVGVLIGSSFVLSVTYACVWLVLLTAFPKTMVIGSIYVAAALYFVCAILSFAAGGIVAGLLCILFGSILCCVPCCMRRQLEFTAKIVDGTATVYSGHRTIFLVAFLVIILQVAWQTLALTATLPAQADENLHQKDVEAAQDKGEDPPPDDGAAVGLFGLMFCYYWGCQVFSNILHVSCAGVIARYYFNKQVDNAVSRSTGQAFTYYLGPIALGSMIVAIIQTLKLIAEKFKDDQDGGGRRGGNPALQIIACVAVCCLGCLERLMELFNNFCFIIVAIYGVSFCDAGREVLCLLTRGDAFNALYAYNFAGLVCFIGALTGATLVACVIGLMAVAMQLTQSMIGGVCAFAFIIGLCIMMVVSRVVESGCDTLIVCYIEEPKALKQSTPELYEAFQEHKHLR